MAAGWQSSDTISNEAVGVAMADLVVVRRESDVC
jgi:hypothetical protein